MSENNKSTIISIFNHKGGVGKTTFTYALGATLAKMGKKVLLVDLDSQCNLTDLVLNENQYREIKNDDKYFNIREFVDRIKAKGVMSRFTKTRKFFPLSEILDKPIPNKDYKDGNKSPYDKRKNNKLYENLYLLPGDISVFELDFHFKLSKELPNYFPSELSNHSSKDVSKKFSDFFRKDGFDDFQYILYDLSPNIGALNEEMLASSDYFIVPVMPDYYSELSIDTLSDRLIKWKNYNPKFPIFLGAVLQRFSTREKDKKKDNIVEAYAEYFEKIYIKIKKHDVVFKPQEVTGDKSRAFYQYHNGYFLGFIKDNRSGVITQAEHLPIYEKNDDLEKEFEEIAKTVIKLSSNHNNQQNQGGAGGI